MVIFHQGNSAEGEILAVKICSTRFRSRRIVCIHRTYNILDTLCLIFKAEKIVLFHDFLSKQDIFCIYHLFLYKVSLIRNSAARDEDFNISHDLAEKNCTGISKTVFSSKLLILGIFSLFYVFQNTIIVW